MAHDDYILEFNNRKKRWELNKRGSLRAIRVADRLMDIEDEARRIARNNAPSQLRIENMGGGVREMANYGY